MRIDCGSPGRLRLLVALREIGDEGGRAAAGVDRGNAPGAGDLRFVRMRLVTMFAALASTATAPSAPAAFARLSAFAAFSLFTRLTRFTRFTGLTRLT